MYESVNYINSIIGRIVNTGYTYYSGSKTNIQIPTSSIRIDQLTINLPTGKYFVLFYFERAPINKDITIYVKIDSYNQGVPYIEKQQSFFMSSNEYWSYKSLSFILETSAIQLYVYAQASDIITVQGELMAIKISE